MELGNFEIFKDLTAAEKWDFIEEHLKALWQKAHSEPEKKKAKKNA